MSSVIGHVSHAVDTLLQDIDAAVSTIDAVLQKVEESSVLNDQHLIVIGKMLEKADMAFDALMEEFGPTEAATSTVSAVTTTPTSNGVVVSQEQPKPANGSVPK